MSFHNYRSVDITFIIYLILGASNLVVGHYVAGVAWLSLTISQLIVQRIANWPANMFDFNQPGVVFAWITYVIFAFLILYHVADFVFSAFIR